MRKAWIFILVLSCQANAAADTIFHPAGSEFSVLFPSKPIISTSYGTDISGNQITISKAELIIQKPAHDLVNF